MPQPPPSFRFPFASLGTLAPEAQAAHTATFNALTDIYQALAQQKQKSSTSTTTINETVLGTTGGSGGGGTAGGVTSFNGGTGDVIFFPSLGGVNDQTGITAYTTQTLDNGAQIRIADASPITITLNYNVSTPYFTTITNSGTSDATIVPDTSVFPSTINGGASLDLPAGSFATVYFDGKNWTADAPGTTAGGVTQLIAGTNVSLSPPGGTGVVTINATAGSISRTPHYVTGSRSFGTVYQNLTGQEMWISGYGLTSGSLTGELTAFVDTVNPPLTDVWGDESTATVAGGKAGFGFVVPNNYYYKLAISAGTGISSLGKWVEYY